MLLDEILDSLFRRLTPGFVLDVGGRHSPYKGRMPSTKYHVLDTNPEFKPDLLGDIHHLKAKAEIYDTILATELLEHCYDPKQAVHEMHRILKKGGVCIASAPFIFPYHRDYSMKDYYRYTRDGMEELFKDFSRVEVIPVGYFSTTLWTLVATRFRFLHRLNPILFRIRFGNMPSGHVVWAVK